MHSKCAGIGHCTSIAVVDALEAAYAVAVVLILVQLYITRDVISEAVSGTQTGPAHMDS